MPLLTAKHKIRTPAGSDALSLATDLTNLANDVDARLSHFSLPYFGKNYVYSGAVHSAPGGLLAAFTAGVAMIRGQTFDFAASGNLVIPANTAAIRFWLTATFDANGKFASSAIVIRTDLVVPADSVLLAVWSTNASAPTGTFLAYRGIIAPGAVAFKATDITAVVSGSTDLVTVTAPLDGQTDVKLEWGTRFLEAGTVDGAAVTMGPYSGPSGSGVAYGEHYQQSNSARGQSVHWQRIIAGSDFLTPKTFYLRQAASAGNVASYGTATSPTFFRGVWSI